MRRERYDFVFSLGSACLCTETVRAAGLQYASYPLDWTRGGTLRERADLVASGFAHWFEEFDFERIENPDAFGHDPYRNKVTGMVFPHEFTKGVPLARSYPEVRARYDRRVSRLEAKLRAGGDVLVVWIVDPQDSTSPVMPADASYALERLSARYSSARFKLFVVDFAKGIPMDSRREMRGDGFHIVAFDYKRYGANEPAWSVRPELLLPLFVGLRAHDYRNRVERQKKAVADRLKKYGRLGARTYWGYVFAKVKRAVRKRL